MTFRPTLPSLTAAAALMALSAFPLAAQEATTDAPDATTPTTETPAEPATAAAPAEPATAEALAEPATADAPAADAAAEAAMAADGAALEQGTPTPEMQAVLDKLAELGAAPIGTVSPEEQRQEPTPADAVAAVMADKGIEVPPEIAAIATREVMYPDAGGGEQPIRIYTPPGEGPFPLVVYYHGGGWVIADLDTYDASARALAAGAGAVVASVEYRKAPENPFPAAHDDANAAYAWIVENSGELNADSERLAVVGESAGGNLAINVAIAARDAALTQPDAMVLVYPVAGNDMETPSYVTYADAQPLSKAGMMWFVEHVFPDPAMTADPRINLVDRTDLAGLPPATIINAQIDPLLSEGMMLADALNAQGVTTAQMTYDGVTHEFFGMGALLPEAKAAQDMAVAALTKAFAAP